MMVEAEATDNVISLIDGGAQAPTEAIVAEGLEAAKPFIARLCTAQQELAAKAAKPTGDFPVFPAYQDDVFAAVEAAAAEKLSAGADHRRQAGARRARPTRSRSRSSSRSPRTSRVARRNSAPRSAR